jgi:hypothetical protein
MLTDLVCWGGGEQRQHHTPDTNVLTLTVHVLHYCNTVRVKTRWDTVNYCDIACA